MLVGWVTGWLDQLVFVIVYEYIRLFCKHHSQSDVSVGSVAVSGFRSVETIGELLIIGGCITMIVIRVHYRIHRTLIIGIVGISRGHLLIFGKCARTLFHDVNGRCSGTFVANGIRIATSIVSAISITGYNHLEQQDYFSLKVSLSHTLQKY